MSRQRRYNLLLTGMTLATIVLLTEVTARLASRGGLDYGVEMWRYARQLKRVSRDPALGHEHIPGRSARLMGVDVRINARGLRDREFRDEPTPGTRRILMLGDSLTFGWGVPLARTTPKRLESLYRAAGERVEVLNAGVGNYNTAMEVESFVVDGHRYHPDTVLLAYFINDAEPTPTYRSDFLTEHSLAWAFVTDRLDASARTLGARQGWADYYRALYRDDAAGWRQARAAMRRLGDRCRVDALRCALVYQPELHDTAGDPFRDVREAVLRAAADAGLETIDLQNTVRGHRPEALWVTPDDAHPNGAADALYARAIFDHLARAPR